MKRWFLAVLCLVAIATQAEMKFFVNDNGLKDVPRFEDQARLLSELGYAGVCTRPNSKTVDLLLAYDQFGLEALATYVTLSAKDREVPDHVVKHFEQLKGRDTLVWLMLLDTEQNASDEETVAIIQKVFDAAASRDLSVVLYPHVGCRTSTIQECNRLRKLADRPGLGISFNLCHFLRQHEDEMIEKTIRTYASHIKLVQINGADNVPMSETNWDFLIKPLGEGDLNVGRVIRTLQEVGYNGPVNLQCYRVPPPARKHLETSMNAWRTYYE